MQTLQSLYYFSYFSASLFQESKLVELNTGYGKIRQFYVAKYAKFAEDSDEFRLGDVDEATTLNTQQVVNV